MQKERKSLQRTVGAWITKPFNNWKAMRAHSHSDCDVQSCEAELAAARAVKEGSVIQQLQQVGEQQRLKEQDGNQGSASMYPLSCAIPYCPRD